MLRRSLIALLACLAPPAAAETVDVYAAGSLRGLVGTLAQRAAPMGIAVHAAARLALLLLSRDGQAAIDKAGLIPLAQP
jgi:hypothetical protein